MNPDYDYYEDFWGIDPEEDYDPVNDGFAYPPPHPGYFDKSHCESQHTGRVDNPDAISDEEVTRRVNKFLSETEAWTRTDEGRKFVLHAEYDARRGA